MPASTRLKKTLPRLYTAFLHLLTTFVFLAGFLDRSGAQTLNAAVDNTTLAFTTTGEWTTTSGTFAKDGVDYVTGLGSNGQPAELRTTVQGPAWVVFWSYATSHCSLLVDGANVMTLYDYAGWGHHGYQLSAGSHQVVWQGPSGVPLRLDMISAGSDLARPLNNVLPGFNWTTGGNVAWAGVHYPSDSLAGRARVNLPYSATAVQESWLETSVTGPCLLEWSQGIPSSGRIELILNGVPFTSGGRGLLPPGTHTVRWRMQRPPGGSAGSEWSGWLENVRITPGNVQSLAAGLRSTGLTWTTGGDAPWDAVNFAGGSSAAYSGLVSDGKTSWLETTVTGPGTMKLSGAPGNLYASITLSVDGVSRGMYILNNDAPLLIGAGSHVLRWAVTPTTAAMGGGELPRVRVDQAYWVPQQSATFAEALSLQGMNFTTPQSMEVFGQIGTGTNKTGIYIGKGSALTGTVTGPAELVWTGTYGNGLPDKLRCSLDGLAVKTAGASSSSLTLTGHLEIPPGQHEIIWSLPATGPSFCWIETMTRTAAAQMPLAQALGGSGITWQAAPEVSAFGSGGKGMACLLLPVAPVAPRSYGLSTTLTGPGVLSLTWKQRSSGYGRFLLDATVWTGSWQMNDEEWTVRRIDIPAGPHTVSLEPPAPSSAGTAAAPVMLLVDEASWQPQQAVSLPEALDAPGLTFTTGGGAAWQGVSGGGADYAHCADVPVGTEGWLETSVTGPGLLSFRLSAPNGNGGFRLDGTGKTVSSTGLTYLELTAGAHTLRWFTTQGAVPAGRPGPVIGNSVSLDEVTWSAYDAQPVSSWTEATGRTFTTGGSAWMKVGGPDSNGNGSLHPVNVTEGVDTWIQTTVSGPAAVSFSLFGLGLGNYENALISVDGTREIRAYAPVGGSGWTDHIFYVPPGSHTVRWTVGGWRPLIWLDRLKITTLSATLMTALDLNTGTVVTSGTRQWIPLTSADLPDGDALVLESGFHFVEDTPTQLKMAITGPGTLTFHVRSTLQPEVRLTGTQWPMSWHDEADGWRSISMAVPSGPQEIILQPNDMDPMIVDRANRVAGTAPPPLASLFPIPGVTWSTSTQNAFVAYTETGVVERPSLICTGISGQPAGWLQAALTGPGTLSFTAQSSDGGAPFRVIVDGKALPSLDQFRPGAPGTSNYAPRMPDERRYSIALGSGAHTVRWLMPTDEAFFISSILLLQEITFTAGGGLVTTFPGGPPTYLSHTAPGPQAMTEAGAPFLRIASQEPLPDISDEIGRSSFGTVVTGPGMLRFHWRKAPGAWPEEAKASAVIWKDDDPADLPATYAIHPLTNSAGWQEMKFFVPAGVSLVSWHLPHTIAGLDLGGFTFTPFTQTLLNIALGFPGKTIITGPDQIWTGVTGGAGNESLAVPPFTNDGSIDPPWIQATFTGPAELTWTQYGGKDRSSPADLDGQKYREIQISPYTYGADIADPFRRVEYALYIPAGSHSVRLKVAQSLYGERTGIGNARFKAVPAVYTAWQPPVPESPDVHTPTPSADYDGDGMSNLAEYTWRTDPYTFNPPLQPVATVSAGRITLTLPAPRPVTDGVRTYVEATTGDLTQWQRVTVETLPSPPAGKVQYRYTVPAGTSRVYLRVGVEFVP